MLLLKDIKNNPDFQHMIEEANNYLSEKGYTEHGFRHVNYVSQTTERILRRLNYDDRTVELGAIAGYLHDIGNMFNRKHHGISGANIVYTELRRLEVPLDDITKITTAIANHDVDIGKAVSPITAALILADKSDAHRTRVNKKDSTFIHDRVNLAIQDSQITVQPEAETITLKIDYDSSISQVMDYFEIYLYRMEMCKEAASYLGSRFRLLINDLELLGHVDYQE
ncbi:HD domain-containing protein [Halanaerobium sp. Z-7514]|uniref:HD domain-containing protein n=1 Tax=Halanaerobium polyolivorans TaxID=2886943 RepID=A0AAW4WWS8_9FIRM|nr:HD domain-containing protein [Halanaerobium polyolivorans]MCC3144183.1 HD domain-containing protein [Halanaerobium polyolivorans]